MNITIMSRDLNESARVTSFDGLVILITGAARAGKSTLGRHLRDRLGFPLVEMSAPPATFHYQAALVVDRMAAAGGAVVCIPQGLADAAGVRDLFGDGAHLHVRRPGDMLVDTDSHKWTANILNGGTPAAMGDAAVAWLVAAALLPADGAP